MAKLVLNDLTSNFGSQALHNANNQAIEDELNNKVLYRNNPDGEPNQMENSIDMNSNDVMNVNAVDVQSLTINGELVVPSDTTITTLPDQAGHAGEFLNTNSATASWKQLNTADVEHAEDSTTYNLATYLQNHHTVNVKDFGAVGDGITDDTAAIQAAVDMGGTVIFPEGNYKLIETGGLINGFVNWFVKVTKPTELISYGATIIGDKGTGSGGKGAAAFIIVDSDSLLSTDEALVSVHGFVFDGGDSETTGGLGAGVGIIAFGDDYDRAINRVEVFNNTFSNLRGSGIRTVNDAASVNLDYMVKDIDIHNNKVDRTHDHGIQTRYALNLQVSDNTFKDAGLANSSQEGSYGDLAIDASTGTVNTLIANNIITGASSGMKCVGSAVVSGNIIEGYVAARGFYGVLINHEDSIVTDNIISKFATGVSVGAQGCIVANNIIRDIRANLDDEGDAIKLTSNVTPESRLIVKDNKILDSDFAIRCVIKNISISSNVFTNCAVYLYGSDSPDLLGDITISNNEFRYTGAPSGGIVFNYESKFPLLTNGLPIQDVVIRGNTFAESIGIATQLGFSSEFGGASNVDIISNSCFRWIAQHDGTFEDVTILNNTDNVNGGTMLGLGLSASAVFDNVLIDGNKCKVVAGASANRTMFLLIGTADTIHVSDNVFVGRTGDTAISFTNAVSSRVVMQGNLARDAVYNINAAYPNVTNY